MVFFTCNACGASLKKNQVEKHYNTKCRQCEVLTCIDCHKDFPGDSYKAHTSCITEAEKYSAKGWQPKANANKGAKKQAAWLDRLETLKNELGDSLDKDVKDVLEAIEGYENIPRKRPKFVNFCKNVLARKFAPASIDKTWEIFQKALKEPSASTEESNKNGKENGGNEINGASKTEDKTEGKKRKLDSDENEAKNSKKSKHEEVEESSPKKKFDWIECTSEILNKKGETKLKKLKKKVVNEYLTHWPESAKSREELENKLEKKLTKSKQFKIANEVVSFSTSRS